MEYSVIYSHGIQSPVAIQDHHPNIDPSLTAHEPWNHTRGRYLGETQPFFNGPQVPQHGPISLVSPINPHPAVHYRNSSPISNQTSGESELTFVDQMPPTPPGGTSPFLGYQSPDNMYQYTGLAATLPADHGYMGSATMPPSAMDFYDHSNAYNNTEMTRDFSFDSFAQSMVDDSTSPAASAPKILMSQRHLSPPNAPEEMLMASTTPLTTTVPPTPMATMPTPPRQPSPSPYPSLPGPSDGDDDDDYMRNLPDDDDSDYNPNGNRKRTRQASSNPRKRPRTIPGPQTPDSSSPSKRPRTSHRSEPYVAHPSTGPITCTECRAPSQTFKNTADLQKHMRQQHTRPFVCVFNFAGCTSTFASKNEWKRHVASQHLLLNFWLCTEGACGKVDNSHMHSPQLPQGAIFNRKDLYTQHVRRMHTTRTVNPRKKGGKKAAVREETAAGIDDRLKNMQLAAHRERCKLPVHMSCPAVGCSQEFRGQNAWDERMEHVAKHLERSASRRADWTGHGAWQQLGNEAEDRDEDEIEFGGTNDPSLVAWASSTDVAVIRQGATGKWELWNPLRGEGANSAALGHHKRASLGSTPTQPIMIVSQRFLEGEDDAEGDYE